MGPKSAPGVIWRSPQPSKNESKTHPKITPTCPFALPEHENCRFHRMQKSYINQTIINRIFFASRSANGAPKLNFATPKWAQNPPERTPLTPCRAPNYPKTLPRLVLSTPDELEGDLMLVWKLRSRSTTSQQQQDTTHSHQSPIFKFFVARLRHVRASILRALRTVLLIHIQKYADSLGPKSVLTYPHGLASILRSKIAVLRPTTMHIASATVALVCPHIFRYFLCFNSLKLMQIFVPTLQDAFQTFEIASKIENWSSNKTRFT